MGNWEKNAILPLSSSAQLHTQDVSPQYPRIFPKDLGSLDFFYRDNVMGPTFGCWFHFLCAFGGLPCGHTFRGNCYWKTTSKQAFSIMYVTLSPQNGGKAMVLWGRKGLNGECVFRILSIENCLDSKMWDFQVNLQVCPQGPNIQPQGSVFPSNFYSLKTHSYISLGRPMRKQAVGLCLRILTAILCLPRRGDIQL